MGYILEVGDRVENKATNKAGTVVEIIPEGEWGFKCIVETDDKERSEVEWVNIVYLAKLNIPEYTKKQIYKAGETVRGAGMYNMRDHTGEVICGDNSQYQDYGDIQWLPEKINERRGHTKSDVSILKYLEKKFN